jgi:hypothetical protein
MQEVSMTAVDRIGQAPSASGVGSIADPRQAAVDVVARLIERVDGTARHVSAARTVSLDVARFGSGGDIYGLRDMARELARAVGASTTEEGRLLRSLSDLARGAALRLYGLAGAADTVRFADLQAAVGAARAEPAGRSPAEDLIARVEAAVRHLETAG